MVRGTIGPEGVHLDPAFTVDARPPTGRGAIGVAPPLLACSDGVHTDAFEVVAP
jgi:hypothetical protein